MKYRLTMDVEDHPIDSSIYVMRIRIHDGDEEYCRDQHVRRDNLFKESMLERMLDSIKREFLRFVSSKNKARRERERFLKNPEQYIKNLIEKE